MIVRVDGRQKRVSIGTYPAISLAEARAEARKNGQNTSQVFPLMKANARLMPTAWFAEGRDPWRDLYTSPVVGSIGELIQKLDELGVYLCRAAAPYLMVMKGAADDAGIALKRKERARWID